MAERARLTATDGVICWSARKSAWLALHAVPSFVFLVLVLAGRAHVDGGVALAAVALTFATVCVGHSVGLHRGIIHRAYRMHRVTRALLAFLASLAGIGPPLTLMRIHKIRDHWQNTPAPADGGAHLAPPLTCPRFYRYEHGVVRDFWWNLHCLHRPAPHAPDPSLADDDAADPVLVFFETWWRETQLLVAVPAFMLGGMSAVISLVSARVTIAIVMHWLVGYFAHKRDYGYAPHIVRARNDDAHDAAEMGRNSLVFGAVSFGEGWHNNHHAFPDSARFGRRWWELDVGWLVIRALAFAGVVWEVNDAPWSHARTLPATTTTAYAKSAAASSVMPSSAIASEAGDCTSDGVA